jgi:hypothetical protein
MVYMRERFYKKMQHNQKPKMKLSDEQIQRLNDAGFKWCLQKKEFTSNKTFDDLFNDLMAFKAKYGHCNVSRTGEDASLGRWCESVRVSYKNNQKPKMKLSDERIRRLSDAGFKWCLQKRELTSNKTFDDRFNDLMAFKAKYGHCNVSTCGEDASLGRWCSVLRGSYKNMQNYQKPKKNYQMNVFSAWAMRVSSGLYEFLMIASMISCLSKKVWSL